MDKVLEEMMEYICDKRCRYPNEVEQEELDEICEQCALNGYLDVLKNMAAGVEEPKEIMWLSWQNGEEYMKIECPMFGNELVMTYYPGGDACYYSYTAPFVEDGEIFYYRYDHDEGCWDESVVFGLGEYEEGIVCKFGRTD